jgi:serine protease AprX
MQRKFFIISVGSLILALLFANFGLLNSSAQADSAPIRLRGYTFNPGLGEKPELPPGLEIASYAVGQSGYYIVQFHGPVQQSWKNAALAQGAELLEYIPDFAFKARMTPKQAAQVKALDSVSWVGVFQPAYKLSPDLKKAGDTLYRVRIESGAERASVAFAIAQSGARIISGEGDALTIAANPGQLNAIARVLDVAWIENFLMYEKHNEYGGGVIMGANAAHANGYDGSSQTVAVADTGLGGGTASTAHPDIPAGRITAIHNWPGSSDTCWNISDDGAVDVDSGHGTHTSASVLSDGDAAGQGAGTAPAAHLVFQAVENYADMIGLCSLYYPDGYYLTGIPADLNMLYQQAYNDGARIHSNSWGSAAAGDYTLDSANSDQFMWTHPDMLITFSAGNEGVDANGDGQVDLDSMGSPATAKNVLTVGASENDRQGNWDCDASLGYTSCAAQGGQNSIFTYGSAWPSDYPANPLASDPSAGNAEQMAAFSSRGPTDDGRIKPDVVAPGTWVLSAYSDLFQQGYDPAPNPRNGLWQYDGWGFPLSQTYKYMGGTSMANPLAAGGAAVVKDYYFKAQGHNASAALTKATLINSAVDLLDENNDGANDNDFPIPNNHEGWGRVNLAAATDGSAQYVDNASGLSTGASVNYNFSVASAGSAFKVTLAWTDYPSSEAAAQNLVNDLDLRVTGPGGVTYQGNVFSSGWSQTGGSPDRTNNVENVYVQSAETGVWIVQVSGYNVPDGPQPFALVVDGNLGEAPTPTPTATPAPSTELHVDSITLSVLPDGKAYNHAEALATVLDNNGAPVSGATVAGSFSGDSYDPNLAGVTDASGQVSFSSSSVRKGSNWTFCVDSASKSGYTYNEAESVTCGSTGALQPSPTPTSTPDPNAGGMHVGDLDDLSILAARSRWDAVVEVKVLDVNGVPISGATVSGVWGSGASGGASCTTNASGVCQISKTNLKSNLGSVSFSVTDINDGGVHIYQAALNQDPDGDSDGTTIILYQP